MTHNTILPNFALRCQALSIGPILYCSRNSDNEFSDNEFSDNDPVSDILSNINQFVASYETDLSNFVMLENTSGKLDRSAFGFSHFERVCWCPVSENIGPVLAVTASSDLQSTWELHYVSYFLRVFKKLFHLKKAYTAEILEKELSYEAIHVQFGEEVAKIVEYLTGEKELGAFANLDCEMFLTILLPNRYCQGNGSCCGELNATSWEPVLEEQMCKDAIHPNILKGTNFNALDPEQRVS
eukprot:gene12724-3445_t